MAEIVVGELGRTLGRRHPRPRADRGRRRAGPPRAGRGGAGARHGERRAEPGRGLPARRGRLRPELRRATPSRRPGSSGWTPSSPTSTAAPGTRTCWSGTRTSGPSTTAPACGSTTRGAGRRRSRARAYRYDDHVLAGVGDPRTVHEELAAQVSRGLLADVLALVPDAWLLPDPTTARPAGPAGRRERPAGVRRLPAGPARAGRAVAAVSGGDRAGPRGTPSSTPPCARSPGSTGASSSTSASSSTARRWSSCAASVVARPGPAAGDRPRRRHRRRPDLGRGRRRSPAAPRSALARENEGQAVRFGMLTAPRSTVVQPSPVHAGMTSHPERTLGQLLDRLVAPRLRPPMLPTCPARQTRRHVAPPDRPRGPAPPRPRTPPRSSPWARACARSSTTAARSSSAFDDWTQLRPGLPRRAARARGPTASSTGATPSTARPSSCRSPSPTAGTRCTGCSAGRTGRSTALAEDAVHADRRARAQRRLPAPARRRVPPTRWATTA